MRVMKTIVIVAVAMLLGACGGSEDPADPGRQCTDEPVAIETLYSIDGYSLTCLHATFINRDNGPLYQACVWLSVVVDGDPMSWATIEFVRDTTGAEWRIDKVHTSPASPGCGIPASG